MENDSNNEAWYGGFFTGFLIAFPLGVAISAAMVYLILD